MADSSWILTKNAVIRKVYEGMGNLAVRMRETVSSNAPFLPAEIIYSNAKISRGENYLSLPYVMMDYPKVFSRNDILAVRTFFWWGNFCSISLHVKGNYISRIMQHLPAAGTMLQENGFYCSTAGDEWNHDVMSSDYAPVSATINNDFLQTLAQSGFIKFSAKVNLLQWSEMEERLYALFLVLINLCGEGKGGKLLAASSFSQLPIR